MKKTTYIMLALIVLGFVAIALNLVLFRTFAMQPKNAVTDFGPSVTLSASGSFSELDFVTKNTGTSQIAYEVEIDSTAQGVVVECPEKIKEYVSIAVKNGVAEITNKAFDSVDKNVPVKVKIPATIRKLKNASSCLVSLLGMDADSLVVDGSAKLIRCVANSISVLSGDNVLFNDCEVNALLIDEDNVYNWSVSGDKSRINTEIITGSDYCRNNLDKGECKRVEWRPKTKNAQLQVTLSEKAVIDVK